MNRKYTREMTMKLIYQMEVTKDFNSKLVEEYLDLNESKELDSNYVNLISDLVINNKEEIDSRIDRNLKGWNLSRIGKIELSILRLAVAEILYVEDIPNKVAINEAIELSKTYADSNASNFINGILGSVLVEL